MNKPLINDYQVKVGESSLIKWGEYAVELSYYASYLEEQIHLRDEKIIKKNKEIMQLNKALKEACDRLETISEFSVNGEIDEICKLALIYGMHVNKEEWYRFFMR